MRTAGSGLVITLLAALAVGCTAPPAAPAPAGGAAVANTATSPVPVALKFGLVTPTAGVAPVWVAKEEGLFTKYGLNPELVTMTADLLMPAIMSGEVPIGNMAATAVVNAALGGADVAYYGSYQHLLPFWFYARPEVASFQDLRGKAVGITGRGGITRRATEIILKRHGVDPDHDVNLVVTGSLANSTTSLISGAVAAAVLSPPGSFEADDAGMRSLATPADYGYRTVVAGLAASRGWVARNEDVMRRALQAVAEGVALALRDKERTKRVIARYIDNDDPALLERTYDANSATWEKSLVVPSDAIRNELEGVAADNPAARDAQPELFLDNRLAEELERDGFVQRLYR
jgi:ABC-type nitrate/sulfonate/bicarbonate transport system substrate-binding protein